MKLTLKQPLLLCLPVLVFCQIAKGQDLKPIASDVLTAVSQDGTPYNDPIPVRRWTASSTKVSLPSSVDNSLLKYFPPVIDQLGGSCAQASYIGYMFTYEVNRLLDRDASLPENRFSYLYTWNFINGGKDDGSIGTDGLALALQNGVITESDFPRQYSGTQFYWASGYQKYFNGMHYRTESFEQIDVVDEAGIETVKRYLYDKNTPGGPGGIVTFSSRAGEWKFDNSYSGPSETGYDCLLTQLSPTGAHAMTIVGYDDLVEFNAPDQTVSKGAFIVANTYGTAFHDKGRFYLPYWFFLQKRDGSDLSNSVTGLTVKYFDPLIVFRVSLDYTSRDDIAFNIGVSGNTSDTVPVHDYGVSIAENQGGDYPMRGRYSSSDIEFGFDFSSHVDKMEGMDEANFFLTVKRDRRGEIIGTGKLLSFSVYDYRQDRDNPKVYVCNDIDGSEFEFGKNIYNVTTVPPPQASCSQVEWLNPQTKEPVSAPLVIRTARGRYAKIRLSGYDRESGTIRLKYVYNPNGSRNF